MKSIRTIWTLPLPFQSVSSPLFDSSNTCCLFETLMVIVIIKLPTSYHLIVNFAGTKGGESKRTRQTYSRSQTLELEKEFHYHKYLTRKRRQEISETLHLTERQVRHFEFIESFSCAQKISSVVNLEQSVRHWKYKNQDIRIVMSEISKINQTTQKNTKMKVKQRKFSDLPQKNGHVRGLRFVFGAGDAAVSFEVGAPQKRHVLEGIRDWPEGERKDVFENFGCDF